MTHLTYTDNLTPSPTRSNAGRCRVGVFHAIARNRARAAATAAATSTSGPAAGAGAVLSASTARFHTCRTHRCSLRRAWSIANGCAARIAAHASCTLHPARTIAEVAIASNVEREYAVTFWQWLVEAAAPVGGRVLEMA